jgi:peptidoglycan/xylan/chitin deacetylase (PgdA/CDA1 family)
MNETGQTGEEEATVLRRMELLIAACLYYSGLVRLARWWTQRSGQRLIILCYHGASGGHLRRQLIYLRRHYRVLHMEEALEELYKPHKNEIRRRRWRTLLALTFDDGYHDNYTDGFVLACELHVPISIFLVPGYIESRNRFWWQEADHLLRYAQMSEPAIEGHTYHLDRLEERKALLCTIHARLQSARSIIEREEFLVTARKALGVALSPNIEDKALSPLTWTEVHEMEESGWVSFGAHTMNHPTLACLAAPSAIEREVSECRVVLERQLGHPVRAFAYPIGKLEHIGENGLYAVQKAGYSWAMTTIHGCNTLQTNPYLLHRIVVDVDQHWLMVAAKASGAWDFCMNLCRIPIAFARSIFRSTRQ